MRFADRAVRESRVDRFSVRNKIEAEGAVGLGQDRVLGVLKLLREQPAGLAAQRHAIGVIIAHDEFEAAPQPIGRGDGRQQFGNDGEHAAFPKMAFLEIGLIAGGVRQGRDKGGIDPISLQRLAVDNEFMRGAVPDDDGPRTADPIEIGAGQGAMENVMIAPSHQQFAIVLELRIGLREPLAIALGACGGRNDARRKNPILDGDDLRHHRQAGQERMIVLGDQTGDDHFFRECLIDDIGLAAGRGLQRVNGADRQDAVAQDGHGGGGGLVGIERDDFFRAENVDLRQFFPIELVGEVL